MSKILKTHDVQDLVAEFARIGIAQSEAEASGRTGAYNRMFNEMIAISNALRDRNDDKRGALSALYKHPNPQVRLKAGIHTLAIFPEAARQVLQELVDRQEFPQAADARGIIRALQEGTFVPD